MTVASLLTIYIPNSWLARWISNLATVSLRGFILDLLDVIKYGWGILFTYDIGSFLVWQFGLTRHRRQVNSYSYVGICSE